MGTLIYDSRDGFSFDDRVLAHLQVVIASKLRRQESFVLAWIDHSSSGGGALRSVWLDPSISVQFVFTQPVLPEINRQWVEILSRRASSNGGLLVEDGLRAEMRGEVPAGSYPDANASRP